MKPWPHPQEVHSEHQPFTVSPYSISAPFLSRQTPSLASKALKVSNFVHNNLAICSLNKAKTFPIVYRNLSLFTRNSELLHFSFKQGFKHFNFLNFYLSFQNVFFLSSGITTSPNQAYLSLHPDPVLGTASPRISLNFLFPSVKWG